MPENENEEFELKKEFEDYNLKVYHKGNATHFDLLNKETGGLVINSVVQHISEDFAKEAWSKIDFSILDNAYKVMTGKNK